MSDEDTTERSSSRAGSIWRWLRVLCILAGLGFMVWLLWSLLYNSSANRPTFQLSGFVWAISIGVIANGIAARLFSDLVSKSTNIDSQKGISAFYHSQIAKYIPGRVAAILVQKSIISGPKSLSATVISNIELAAISAWLSASAGIALIASAQTVAGSLIIASVAVAGGAWLMLIDWQPLMRRIHNLAPRKLSPRAATIVEGRPINLLHAIILCTCMLVLPACSSYVLLSNGMNINHALAVPLTALLLLSWVGGSLAFIFPAGIGVRELIFFALGGALWNAPSNELIAGVALASRFAHILIDIAGVLLFAAWRGVVTPFSGRRHEH